LGWRSGDSKVRTWRTSNLPSGRLWVGQTVVEQDFGTAGECGRESMIL